MSGVGFDPLTFNPDSDLVDLTLDAAIDLFDGEPDPHEAALAFVQTRSTLVCQFRKAALAVYLAYELWEELGYRTAEDGATADGCLALSRRTYYRWKSEIGYTDGFRARRTSEGMLQSERVRRSRTRLLADRIGVSGDQIDLFEPTGKYVTSFSSRLLQLGANHLSIDTRRQLFDLGVVELRIGLGLSTEGY